MVKASGFFISNHFPVDQLHTVSSILLFCFFFLLSFFLCLSSSLRLDVVCVWRVAYFLLQFLLLNTIDERNRLLIANKLIDSNRMLIFNCSICHLHVHTPTHRHTTNAFSINDKIYGSETIFYYLMSQEVDKDKVHSKWVSLLFIVLVNKFFFLRQHSQ